MKKLITTLFLFLANTAFAEVTSCNVVAVIDGDTIKCLTDNKKELKIRLYQIDAPEKKQAFGNKSKQALSDLIFNMDVMIEDHGVDRYKRILGTIYKPLCAYSIVHQRFNVASIEDLSQAVEYVHKVALEGEYIPKEISTSRQVSVNKTNLSCLINSMEWIYKYYKEYNLLEVTRLLKSDLGAKLHDHIISGYTSSRSLN